MDNSTTKSLVLSGTITEVMKNAVFGINEGEKQTGTTVSTVDLELSAIVEKGKDGKFDLKILGAGQKVAEQNVHKIKFTVCLPEDITSRITNRLAKTRKK